MTLPTVSYEFFPPKTPEAETQLWPVMERLAALQPAYMTVTYGAAGSTKDGTLDTLRSAVRRFPHIPVFSHLSFLSTQKAALADYAARLLDAGARGIVALRGDLPKGAQFGDFSGPDYFAYAYDFIAFLKAEYPFEIIVGAYPEKHPDAPDLAADIAHLKKKCEAGADRVTTQFFFDNAFYYRFIAQCRAAGITVPVNPGLLPVHDPDAAFRFAGKCGAHVPDDLRARFEVLRGREDETRRLATETLTAQALDLAANGARHIHFYSMNRAEIVEETVKSLGVYSKI